MKASYLQSVLAVSLRSRVPVMLWGQPGVGKSSLVAQVAEKMGYQVLDWRLALKDPVDLMGIPSVDKGLTRWNPPAELPKSGKWIVFMDELMQSRTETLNAATQLILDRKLGSYCLPDDAVCWAASNLEGDRAATNKMPTHVANRFQHYRFDVDLGDFMTWATSHGIDARVLAFVKYRPEFLHRFDPKSTEKAFASPRSWEFMSRQLASMNGETLPNDVLVEMASGIIGTQAATEFVGFLRIMDRLVSIDQILLAPDTAEVPVDPIVCYALVYALLQRATRANLGDLIRYFERMKQREFLVLFMREVKMRKEDLLKTKAFIEWASKNKDCF